MPIHLPPAPTRVLPLIIGNSRVRGDAVTRPHPIYMISEDALTREDYLATARPIGWRSLVMENDVAIAAAEVTEDLTSVSINEGQSVQATIVGVLHLESLVEVQRDAFELRLLKIPSRYVAAIWLHGEREDLLLPMPERRVYSPAELRARVTESTNAAN